MQCVMKAVPAPGLELRTAPDPTPGDGEVSAGRQGLVDVRHGQPHLPVGRLGAGPHPAAAHPRPRDVRRGRRAGRGRHHGAGRRPRGGGVARHLRQMLPVSHRQCPRLQELHHPRPRPRRLLRPVRRAAGKGAVEDGPGDPAGAGVHAGVAGQLGPRRPRRGRDRPHAAGDGLRADGAVRHRRRPHGRGRHDPRHGRESPTGSTWRGRSAPTTPSRPARTPRQ